MIVVSHKRCSVCHADLPITLADLMPWGATGHPGLECQRCGRRTRISLAINLVSGLVGFGVTARVVHDYIPAAEATFGKPLGAITFLAMFPIGLATFMIAGALFGALCYLIADLLGRKG